MKDHTIYVIFQKEQNSISLYIKCRQIEQSKPIMGLWKCQMINNKHGTFFKKVEQKIVLIQYLTKPYIYVDAK